MWENKVFGGGLCSLGAFLVELCNTTSGYILLVINDHGGYLFDLSGFCQIVTSEFFTVIVIVRIKMTI